MGHGNADGQADGDGQNGADEDHRDGPHRIHPHVEIADGQKREETARDDFEAATASPCDA